MNEHKILNKNEGIIRTYSGIEFQPFDPTPESIDIEDIAHSLGNLCRFGGHSNEFYSVAQHSVLVSRMCSRENALWGLLHDAAEAYFNDIPSPVKKKLVDIKKLEENLLIAIAKKFDLKYPMPKEIKKNDIAIFELEWRYLMEKVKDRKLSEKILGEECFFKPIDQIKSKELFLKEFDILIKNY